MPTGLEKIRALRKTDRESLRKKILIMLAVVLVLFLAMSCMRSTTIGFISPAQAAANIFTAVKLEIARIFHWELYNQRAEIIAQYPYYYETLGNCRATLIALIMGAVLAMAGGVYQNVFRNPIATPSMLGITSGVNISNLILVAIYGSTAVQMVSWRFVWGFVISVVSLLCIYFLSRLMGSKKASVTDMLLVGTIFMRVAQNFISVYEYYIMDEDTYLIVEEMNLYGANLYESYIIYIVLGVLAVSVLIVVLMRFSLNAMSFTDEESKTLGVNSGRLRLIVLVCGTLMTTAVQVNYGDIGMMALLIPHLCRNWFGCDFRNVLLGSAGCGAILMMICRLIRYMLNFNEYLSLISMGTIINVVVLPVIIIILFNQNKAWKQE